MHVEVIEVVRPRLTNPKEISTMSDTMTAPAPRAAAVAANGAQMHAALEAKTASLTLADRVRALPAAAAETLRGALRVFRLEGATESALGRLRAFASGLLGRVGQLGWGTLAGVLLTAGKLRRTAVRWVSTAVRIVATPVRWAWAGVSWLLRKVGLGSAVDWVDGKVAQAKAWTSAKVEAGLTWMDGFETDPIFTAIRDVMQATLVSRIVMQVFPWFSTPLSYVLAYFFVPTFGALPTAESAAEEAAIVRAADKLRTAGEAVASAAVEVPAAKAADLAAKAAVADAKLAEVKATEAPAEFAKDNVTGELFPVERITRIDGSKWVGIGDFMLPLEEAERSYEFGTVQGEMTEAEAVAAGIPVASNGAAPKLHGPGNRAAKRPRK